MSYKHRATSPYRNNPQNQVQRVTKMQNLLQEYDRENAFLGKQVTDLITINKMLHSAKPQKSTPAIPKDYLTSSTPKHDYRKKRYQYFNQIENYYPPSRSTLFDKNKKYSKNHDTKINQQMSRNQRKQKEILSNEISQKKEASKQEVLNKKIYNKEKQLEKSSQKQPTKSPKKVQFTRDPYIQKSDIRTFRETEDIAVSVGPVSNSPLKQHSKSSAKKQGIQITNKSLSKEKDQEPVLARNQSLLSAKSNKSSRMNKSGIQVISRESSPSKISERQASNQKIQLPMTTRLGGNSNKQIPVPETPIQNVNDKRYQKAIEQLNANSNKQYMTPNTTKNNLDQSRNKQANKTKQLLKYNSEELLLSKKQQSYIQSDKKYSYMGNITQGSQYFNKKDNVILLNQNANNNKNRSNSVQNVRFNTNPNIVEYQYYPDQINKKITNPTLKKQASLADIYDRSQSQSRHRIEPSTKITNFHNMHLQKKGSLMQVPRKNIQHGKSAKKKFINVITKAMIDEGKQLRRVSFKK